MAPRIENEKTQGSKKKFQDELLEKLKLEEEKVKKKLEKEAKRRAELEKVKSESFMRQADLLVPLKKEKQLTQSKKYALNSQTKTSKQRKQSHNSNQVTANSVQNNQGFSFEPKTSVWNKKQSTNSQGRFRYDSSSSENSSKRYGENCWGSSKNSSVSDSLWSNRNEHFPMLGAEAPVPTVNVWEERKYKQEEIQALQPQNQYDEEAMLQQALALSLMEATREEERKQKLDEQYKLQMEVLEKNPKMLDNFKESDEVAVYKKSELESFTVSESTEEQLHNQKFSRNAALSSIIQKSNASNSGGARPKINKIIDSFGGWGLKDSKTENSKALSNFTDNIDEKTWKNGHHLPGFQKGVVNKTKKTETVNNWKIPATDAGKQVSDSWSNDFNNDNKTSSALDPWENEVSSDEKVSFDVSEVSSSHLNSTAVCFDSSSKGQEYVKEKRSDDVSGMWLNSDDEPAETSDQWDDVSPKEKPTDIANINSVEYLGSSSINDTKTNLDNAWGSVSNFEAAKLLKEESSKNSIGEHDSLDNFTKSSMAVGTPVGSYSIKKEKELSNGNIFSQFENTYNYASGETGKLKDESVPAKTSLSDDLWIDESPIKSTPSNSAFLNENILLTELHGKESFKFSSGEKSCIMQELTSNKEVDAPIFPPHPIPVVPETNESNQAINAQISGDKCAEESPPLLPPQAPPPMPSPYLFNSAVFPGVNPMLGLGMDPITVRQMLMLSNPFFASQLLSMEQYYRALGVPVDLFSFPTQPVPNMLFPNVENTSEQNSVLNPFNVNVSSTPLQSQCQDQSVLSNNIFNVPSEYPSGLNRNATANLSDTEENLWYASLLSTDNESVIPPPKPLDAAHQVPSTSQPLEKTESASNFVHNLNSKEYMSSNLPSNSLGAESHKAVTAVENSMPKTEVSGWGDLNEESFHKGKSKNNSCDDDYGWNTEGLPAKSVKNPSKHEDKKVIHRQPARQPQLSRFQRNRRFN